MKKSLFLAVVLLGLHFSSIAQEEKGPPPARGVIIKWALGYTWSGSVKSEYVQNLNTDLKNPLVDAFVNMANSSDADGSYKPIHTTYGQGLNVSFRIGYMFNPYIGFDVGVTYSQSADISSTQLHYLYLPDSTGVLQPSGGYLNCQLSSSARSVSVSPSIIAAFAKPKFKFYPYVRIGLTLPVWTQVTQKIGIDLVDIGPDPNAPYFIGTRTDITIETKVKFAIGFNAAFGVVYKPAPFMGLFFELTGQYLNLQAKSSEITQWDADGVDLLPSRGAYRNQFNYVSSLTGTSNNAQVNSNYNPNQPKDDISYKIPYSNLGFNLGIQLIINKSIYNDGNPKKKRVKQISK